MEATMKYLLYIIALLSFAYTLQSKDWEKVDLPTSAYYRIAYDEATQSINIIGTDRLPPSNKISVFPALTQTLLNAGAEPSYLDQASISNPYPDVYFAVSLDGYSFYSHDGGNSWHIPTIPKQIITYHFERKFVALGNKVFFLDAYNRIPLVSVDSCKTWQKHSDDNFFDIRKINDETIFYFGKNEAPLGTEDYIVYKNISTNSIDSSIVPEHILYWSYENMTVRGDTITIYNQNSKVYQSNNRGKDWFLLSNLHFVFQQFIYAPSLEGTEYSIADSIIVASRKFQESDGSFQPHYIVSLDFGENWYSLDTIQPILLNSHCYFPKGTFKKYNTKYDLLEDVTLATHRFGNLRIEEYNHYYQFHDSNDYFTKKINETKWTINTSQYYEYKNKNEAKYFLDKNSNLRKSNSEHNIILKRNISSFQVVLETPWIDILTYHNNIDNSNSTVFIKELEIVEDFSNTQHILPGINHTNPDLIYYIDFEKLDNIRLVLSDTKLDVKDTLPLNVDIGNEQIIKTEFNQNVLYLVGNTNIFISTNRGQSFYTIPNPQKYKSNDILFDNIALNQGTLYTAGSEGVLRLTDELEWEQLLEDVTDSYAFAVEFMDNRIYAYTEHGLYIYDAPGMVSTDISNKNVLLEHSSGMYSEASYIRDYYAQELKNAAPDDFYYVLFHPTSEYTTPKHNTDLDLRTESGDTLADYLNIDSYIPSLINRKYSNSLFKTEVVNQLVQKIQSQKSPVNIATNATIDPTSKELDVDVSYYFTEEVTGQSSLSVFLIQDYIKGDQTRNTYIEEMHAADGSYYHRNVFRMQLNEELSGDYIENTSKDVYGEKHYKITLPDSIRNVKLELADLRIVAFITNHDDSERNVLQSTGTNIILPEENLVDLSMEDITDTKHKYFFDYLKPKVRITNNSNTTVNQFDLTIKSGAYSNTQTFNKDIIKNRPIVAELDSLEINVIGNYSYSITGFENLNNSEVTGKYIGDNNPLNNDCLVEAIRLKNDAFEFAKFTFEDNSEPHFGLDRTENGNVYVIEADGIGAEDSDCSIRFDLNNGSNISDKPAYVVFGEANLTNKDAAYLSFYYAYDENNQDSTAPVFSIEYSENEGFSWKKINTLTPKATFSATQSNLYPNSNDYQKIFVALDKCLGKKFILRIGVLPGTAGNTLWLDQVSIDEKRPNIYANPENIDFGKVTLNHDFFPLKSTNISNGGLEDLIIDSVRIRGADQQAFLLTTHLKDTTLAYSENINLFVRFYPNKEQQYKAYLEIYSNDPDQELLLVRIEGIGEGTSVYDNIANNKLLSVSPNPSSDYINIDFPEKIDSIEIIDLLGNLFYSAEVSKQIDISYIPSGTYFLKIKSGDKIYLKQFVVTK